MAENTEARKEKQPAHDQPPITHGARTDRSVAPNRIPFPRVLSSREGMGKEKAEAPAVQTLEKNSVLYDPSSYLSPLSSPSHTSHSVLLN